MAAAPLAAAASTCLSDPPRAAAIPPDTAADPIALLTPCDIAKPVVFVTALEIALPTMGVIKVVAPAKAADVSTSFKLPPDAKVTPALKAAAPTTGAKAALAPSQVPTAGIKVGKNMATAGMMIGAIFFTAFLKPRHRSLKKPNSGKPVSGLTVPDPPRAFSNAASSGVMCARMVSPPRPCDCSCWASA